MQRTSQKEKKVNDFLDGFSQVGQLFLILRKITRRILDSDGF